MGVGTKTFRLSDGSTYILTIKTPNTGQHWLKQYNGKQNSSPPPSPPNLNQMTDQQLAKQLRRLQDQQKQALKRAARQLQDQQERDAQRDAQLQQKNKKGGSAI